MVDWLENKMKSIARYLQNLKKLLFDKNWGGLESLPLSQVQWITYTIYWNDVEFYAKCYKDAVYENMML